MGQGSFWSHKQIEPSEYQIQISIGHFLRAVVERAHPDFFHWTNPSGGFYDTRLKRFRKHHDPYALVGAPDKWAVWKGHLIALEIKSKKGVQSKDQKLFQTRLEKSGAHYFIVRSVNETQEVLQSIGMSISN